MKSVGRDSPLNIVFSVCKETYKQCEIRNSFKSSVSPYDYNNWVQLNDYIG